MSGWCPIETAPKDGSWFLAFDSKGVADNDGQEFGEPERRLQIFMAHWVEKEWIACFGEVDGWGCPSGGYDHWVSGLIVAPSHWMPLPKAPS